MGVSAKLTIIPDTVEEKPQEGVVSGVGPGARDDSGKVQPLDLKACRAHSRRHGES